jgi:carboxyl-terminal processing protease
MLRIQASRFIAPLLLIAFISTQDFACCLATPSPQLKAIPDTEPKVTALVRSMIQKLSSGRPLEGVNKNDARGIQKDLTSFGRLRSLELVNREVKAKRTYTYRLTFSDVVGFLTIDLGAEDKLEGLHYWSELSLKTRQEIFNTVWETINKEYFDPEFGGVDWAAARQRYAPQAASAKNDAEFQTVLAQMLQELKTSHLGITGAEDFGAAMSFPILWTGLSFRDIDNEVVITRILKDSPAERAGLRLGSSIKKIDDAAVSSSRETFNQLYEKEIRRITFVDEQDVMREVELQNQLPPSDQFEKQQFGNSTVHALLESRRLAGDIGYIHFTVFLPALKTKLLAALESMRDAPGVIIDLRGNGGGSDALGNPMASALLGRETVLGINRTRKGDIDWKSRRHKNPYKGVVAILVDGDSGSESEAIAAGLQDAGRAVVIGKKTAGGVMDGKLKPLPAGALFLYPVGQSLTTKGVILDGRGVIPDIEVNLTRAELLKGRDSQLEAAIEYIRTHKR